MTDIISLIRRRLSSMPAVLKRIGGYILSDPQRVTCMTMKELSAEVEVSEGSVVNFATRLGYDGYSAMKIAIARSLAAAKPLSYEGTAPRDEIRDIIRKVRDNTVDAIRATCECVTDEEIRLAATMLMSAKKQIVVYGIGSSAMLAEDGAFRLMKLGLPTSVVKDSYIAGVSALTLDGGCVAVAISYTGRTKDLIKTMTIAKEKGAKTICITCYADSPLAELCDVPLVVVSGEAVVNKLATVSRMAQLMIIDIICEYIASRHSELAARKQDEIINAWGDYWVGGRSDVNDEVEN